MPDFRRAESPRALLVSPDPRLAAEMERLLLAEAPGTTLKVVENYPDQGQFTAVGTWGWQLCFMDVVSEPGAAFATMSMLASAAPHVPVFALLRSDDPDLILQCLRQGATGFLVQPFTADQFRDAVAKLSRFRPPAPTEAPSRTRVYCVVPSKGACGGTTVAYHLAFALRREGKGKVLLADLDALTGTLAFVLKLKSAYSFVDALAHTGSLDADVWKALVTPCHGVDVLLSPENPMDGLGETADPVPLLGYSRRAYEHVVLDTGGAFGNWNLALAKACDDLLLVTTNELGALHAAQRVQAYLKTNHAESAKVRLVVNRYSRPAGLQREAIETALRREVLETLPSDYESIHRSLMDGKTAPPGSAFGKAITRLAQRLANPVSESALNIRPR